MNDKLSQDQQEELEAAMAGAAAHLETVRSILETLTAYGPVVENTDPDAVWRRAYAFDKMEHASNAIGDLADQLRLADITAKGGE